MYLSYDKGNEHKEDPADQFMWLEHVLNSSVAKQQKASIDITNSHIALNKLQLMYYVYSISKIILSRPMKGS